RDALYRQEFTSLSPPMRERSRGSALSPYQRNCRRFPAIRNRSHLAPPLYARTRARQDCPSPPLCLKRTENPRMPQPLNKFSSRITQVKSQGASQAMLYGTGLSDADLQKAQVGIAAMWYEGNTCNMHLNRLAARVKEGVDAAGLVG